LTARTATQTRRHAERREGLSGLARVVFRLRPEEFVALLFLVPTTYLTLNAHAYVLREGIAGARYPGGTVRLGVALIALLGLWAARRAWPSSRLVQALREVLPFLTCILIYTNLHDTIGFVNKHDVHAQLVAFDQWMFGVQPCVWAERFISRGNTEVMSFFYLSFAWLAPSTSVILLAQRRVGAFRAATFGALTCFFMGYGLYLLFPAAPPRLVLRDAFSVSLAGYPQGFTGLGTQAIELLPVDSRAAFPSLHAAVSLVVLIYAWRYLRTWFWVALPLAVGLWVSTIYLRHHYVADLLAGWALAPLAVWAAPRLDRAWVRQQRAAGVTPALGVETGGTLDRGTPPLRPPIENPTSSE
jgi:membrane-associated phospholipid phosphatase